MNDASEQPFDFSNSGETAKQGNIQDEQVPKILPGETQNRMNVQILHSILSF